MLRRTFLQGAGAALLSGYTTKILSAAESNSSVINWSNGIKPLYCQAFIDPANKVHRGQELAISKYPIALIPQDNRVQFGQFRTKLRRLNPLQTVLAYHATLDENGVPGPAHDLVRKLKNSWITLPGGIVPTIDLKSGNVLKRRIYDPRDAAFRKTFIDACGLLIDKYKFDGIFLDNCTIYPIFANIPYLGDELKQGLQELIHEVRLAFPKTILIGNSSYTWSYLNGEMNEGRPKDLPKEALDISGHTDPKINMFHYYMKDQSDLIHAENNFRFAIENHCFYGTGINAQTIRWYPFFDKVLSEYKIVL